MNELSIRNQRLLDLYDIPLKTNDNEIANLFVMQRVKIEQKDRIEKAKEHLLISNHEAYERINN